MSIPAVVKDVELLGAHLFDHTPIIKQELEKFVERFERNERHREFDGIIRASHALIEASETPVEALFDTGKMTQLTADVDALADRVRRLTRPQYATEHSEYLASVNEEQDHYLEVCRTEAQRKLRAAN